MADIYQGIAVFQVRSKFFICMASFNLTVTITLTEILLLISQEMIKCEE